MRPGIHILLLVIIVLLIHQSGCRKKQKTTENIMTEQHYSTEDFIDVLKIDTHAHINTEGTAMIDEARANNFKLINIAVDVVPEYPPMPEQIRVRSKLYRENPDVAAYCTSFTLEGWDEPGWADHVIEQLKEDFENDAAAVKVWKNIGMEEKDKDGELIMLDDPQFDPVFQHLSDDLYQVF